MTTHEKALEAAVEKTLAVFEDDTQHFDGLPEQEIKRRVAEILCDGAVSAYISALTPPDVAGLVGRLENERPFSMIAVLSLHMEAASTLTHLAAENALLRGRKGWKLVPVEPMPMQLEQAASNLADEFGPDFVLANKSYAMAVYAAMLAASPSHQEQNNG